MNAKKGQFHIPVDSGSTLPPAANIKEKVKTFPDQPGCYIMKDAQGKVIYVGKAISLKHRVMSYFTDNASREPYYADKIVQIGLCPAPCSGNITPEEYMKNIRNIMRFLEGDSEAILADLQNSMDVAVKGLDFEQAAIYRDRIQALEKTLGKQDVLDPEPTNKDIIACSLDEQQAAILVLHIRKGRVLGRRPYILDVNQKLVANNEILPVFLEQYYTDKTSFIPDQIVIEHATEEINTVKRVLEELHPQLRVIEPEPGSKDEGMLKIAEKNIGLILGQRRLLAEQTSQKMKQIFEDLHDKIPGLKNSPAYIEAFDISNTQGSNPTASMVVFRNGQPAPQEYRRYRIRLKETPDDVAMMKEVVQRRYSRLLRENHQLPDLVLVDGGKGQLNAAVEILQNLNLPDQPVIGLAKREEEVYIPGRSDPINLGPTSTASRVFQAIRDEAHRFAVTYHRLLRQKSETTSELDAITGVGPKRRKQLLATFGSIDGIKRASLDDLKTVLLASVAETLFNAFAAQKQQPEKKKFKVWLPEKPSA